MDTQTEYHFYKADFMSAYNANGKNIDLALIQVSRLRNVDVEHLKVVLRNLVILLKNKNYSKKPIQKIKSKNGDRII